LMQKLKIIVGIVASPRMMSTATSGGKKSKAQPTVPKGIRHGLGTERNVGRVSEIRHDQEEGGTLSNRIPSGLDIRNFKKAPYSRSKAIA
jgi:hypothetical protein